MLPLAYAVFNLNNAVFASPETTIHKYIFSIGLINQQLNVLPLATLYILLLFAVTTSLKI